MEYSLQERMFECPLDPCDASGPAEELVRCLTKQGRTLATAESCTGGLLGKLLTDIPGVSACYLGGVISYANSVKHALLGVPDEILAEFGAVSPQTASFMAQGARNATGSDIALATTGIAGPGGGTEEKPVGLVYAAVAAPDRTEVFRLRFPSALPRDEIRFRTAEALFGLAREILGS